MRRLSAGIRLILNSEFPQINIFSDTDYDGRTALMYASHVGNLPVIKWLLKGGADINAIDKRHKTALHYALQLVFYLLASVKILRRFDHKMFYQQDDKIVKFLLTKGANFLAKDNSGQISLHYAVSNKTSTEALRLLLKLINDPYTCHLDNCGVSILSYSEQVYP